MNPDFEIKINRREGSGFGGGTYPEELSCYGYMLFTFDGDSCDLIMHGDLPTKLFGAHLASCSPQVARDFMAGITSGRCDEDNQALQ